MALARKLAVIMHRIWFFESKFAVGVAKPKMAAA
jgi:hypothetical protein